MPHLLLLAGLVVGVCGGPAVAVASPGGHGADWPGLRAVTRVLTLRDYNTRVVVLGTSMLGAAAGVIGTFAYLRKRAMMGDALSHATLPGIAAVFLLTGEKNLLLLLGGAAVTGILGVLAVIGIRQASRLKEDAAIGLVLSVFFGAGMVLFSLVQQMKTGNEAGLQAFIYGKAAAMGIRDAWLIGLTALIVVAGALLLFKEFRVVCFDPQFAAAQGHPVVIVDLLMMAFVVLVTVIGLQAVGLIMVVALLIIPAAAARFWTDGLIGMTVLAGAYGAISGWMGSTISALLPRMPAGAIIVISAGAIFLVSMVAAPRRGVLASVLRRWLLRRRIAYQNLLRAAAEIEEAEGVDAVISVARLRRMRTWSAAALRGLLRRAVRDGVLTPEAEETARLTPRGRDEARRQLRNHRLWEMYLIKYADIAPSHVDRDADEVEHVLSPEIIEELDRALAERGRIPPSPHAPLPVAYLGGSA